MKSAVRPARVLIVEDEAIISLDIKRLLTSAGFSVAGVAASAEQAIRAIETSPPDLVLMDIHLKGPKDGIETALQIRAAFRVPVVFVTAHADASTLERARQTEPYGYIVKPISTLSLTSTIEMALHKHRIERSLDEHRAWLDTVLQSIPDAVVATDLAGKVQFLNSAAAQLVEAGEDLQLGRDIDDLVPISSGKKENLASQFLDKAEWGNRVAFPKDAVLTLEAQGRMIPVEGDVVISYSGDQPTGAILTLRDVSRREQEESIERQDERMAALGRLASTIAHDFNSLHSLLASTATDLTGFARSLGGEERAFLLDKADTITRVHAIAALMTDQLVSLSEQPKVRATLVSASGVVASVEPLFNKLSTGRLQVDIHLSSESTLVLCHPDRLSILLVNVFLNARERMAGAGRIRISTGQVEGNGVGIVFDLEHMGAAPVQPLAFPLEMENPDFSLSIAHALIAAMEGSIVFTQLSDKEGRIEIVLPRQFASQTRGEAAGRMGAVLLIGKDLGLFAQLEEWLDEARYGVIRCSSASEALLLGQLYDSKIDCVVADSPGISAANRRKLRAFFSSRNAQARFVRLVASDQRDEGGWLSWKKAPYTAVLEKLGALLGAGERKLAASI